MKTLRENWSWTNFGLVMFLAGFAFLSGFVASRMSTPYVIIQPDSVEVYVYNGDNTTQRIPLVEIPEPRLLVD